MDIKSDNRQLNNKGFSLVELIVIMVIVVIMATAVVVSFVNSSDQKVKAATNVVSNYLRDVLNYSMTKGTSYMTIRYDSAKDIYYVEDNQGHSEKLASGIKVSYDKQNGDKDIAIDENRPTLILSFSRTNGSFTPVIESVNSDGTFNYVTQGEANTYVYADHINIKGNNSGKTIHLYTNTGEYEIEDTTKTTT